MVTYQKKKKEEEKNSVSIRFVKATNFNGFLFLAIRVTLSCVLEFSIYIPKDGMSLSIRLGSCILFGVVCQHVAKSFQNFTSRNVDTIYPALFTESLNHKNHEV